MTPVRLEPATPRSQVKLLIEWLNHGFRPPDKSVYWKTVLFFSHSKHVVCTRKNRLNETVLLSTQNTCLN